MHVAPKRHQRSLEVQFHRVLLYFMVLLKTQQRFWPPGEDSPTRSVKVALINEISYVWSQQLVCKPTSQKIMTPNFIRLSTDSGLDVIGCDWANGRQSLVWLVVVLLRRPAGVFCLQARVTEHHPADQLVSAFYCLLSFLTPWLIEIDMKLSVYVVENNKAHQSSFGKVLMLVRSVQQVQVVDLGDLLLHNHKQQWGGELSNWNVANVAGLVPNRTEFTGLSGRKTP